MPSTKFPAPRSALVSPFTFILPLTKVVPVGIESVTFTVPVCDPVFVNVIV